MGKSSNRKSRRRQLQASHQKNWLIGLHAVTETLRARTWLAERVCVGEDVARHDQETLGALAAEQGLTLEVVSTERLTELCSSRHHQGVAARMQAFRYSSADDLWGVLADTSDAGGRPPLVVVCDRLQDSHNLGAILRSCDATQVAAVIIGPSEQVGITPQVARSSAGAVNHLPIVLSDNLRDTCVALQERGYRVASASEKASGLMWDQDLAGPTALIIGNEAQGVSPALLECCDTHLCIPMLGRISSLNAAVAAGILLYEIRRQQGSSK